jgi:hypothetical protein
MSNNSYYLLTCNYIGGIIDNYVLGIAISQSDIEQILWYRTLYELYNNDGCDFDDTVDYPLDIWRITKDNHDWLVNLTQKYSNEIYCGMNYDDDDEKFAIIKKSFRWQRCLWYTKFKVEPISSGNEIPILNKNECDTIIKIIDESIRVIF